MTDFIVRLVLSTLIVLGALALAPATPALAESAELMKHFRQYHALQKAGKYKKAEFHALRALELGEEEFGTAHQIYATLLNNLAALYWVQGRYGEAEPLYIRDLNIRKKALGPDHPDVGQSPNNLAELYRVQGRYGEAEPLYRRSVVIFKKALGGNHSDVGQSFSNLAGLYFAQSDWQQAAANWRLGFSSTARLAGEQSGWV